MNIVNTLNIINDFLNQYYTFKALKFIEAVILIVLTLNISILIYILIIRDKYFHSFSMGHSLPDVRNSMNKEWDELIKKFSQGDLQQQKKAVVEAGTLVFELFHKIKYEGQTLEEQLNNIPIDNIGNLKELQVANEIKNKIVNNEAESLTERDLFKALKTFGEALLEQEAISEMKL